jgi:hypothetical protein
MKISFKKSIMFMMILLALTVSALGVTPALADDSVTPPVDAPAVEEPVADAPVTEESVADAPAAEEPVADAPIVEQPAAEEPVAEDATVAEILEAAPEGTEVVVLDETGEALPLASEDAAVVLAAPDPYFTVGGTTYRFFDSAGDCSAYNAGVDCFISAGDTPIQDAIDFLAGLDATPDDGYVYVEGGTYNESVTIDGSLWSGLGNFGLIGESSDVTTINGSLNAFNLTNAFDLAYFTFTDWVWIETAGDVYSYDVVVDGSSADGGMTILSGGTVQLDSVASTQSTYDGLYVNAAGDINIWDSAFYDNTEDGAYLYSDAGNVYVENSDFSDNGLNGIEVNAAGDITLNSVSGYNSVNDGANLYSYSGGIFVDNSAFAGNGNYDLVADAYYTQLCGTEFSESAIEGCEEYWADGGGGDDSEAAPIVEETIPVETVSAADLPALTLENLPAPLPPTLEDGATFSFVGGFDATSIEILEGESVTVEFSLPEGIDPENLAILMFIDGAWVELTDFVILPDGTIELTIEVAGEIVFGTK